MRYFPILAAGALALALSAVTARNATAFSTLTVTSLYCEDTGGGGTSYNETYCYAEVSGGTGGNTYHWDVIVTSQSDGPNYSSITGVCTDSYPVTFTVTDSSGATANVSETFVCYASSTGDGSETP